MLICILNTLRSRIWDMAVFLFSVFWLQKEWMLIVFGEEMGEVTEGCGLFWYCLRDAINDDKMISQLSLYMVNLSLYIKVTTLFFVKWQSSFSLLLVKSEKIIFGRYIFRASSSLLISPLVSTKAYCIHSFWSQNTEKRNTTISQMRLRSVFKMRMSILNTATTEQMGYGSISFFVCFL